MEQEFKSIEEMAFAMADGKFNPTVEEAKALVKHLTVATLEAAIETYSSQPEIREVIQSELNSRK